MTTPWSDPTGPLLPSERSGPYSGPPPTSPTGPYQGPPAAPYQGSPTAPYQGPPAPYQGPPPGYQGPPPGPQVPVGPPAYGYGDPPPTYGSQVGPGYPPPGGPPGAGDPWSAWGPPQPPPGMVLIPGHAPMEAATPGQRALGRLIDSVGYLVLLAGAIAGIVAIISNASSNSFSYSYEYGYPSTTSGDLAILWIYPILGAVWLLIVGYESLMIGLTGATLGDRVVGVRFVNSRTGAPPGFGRGLGRAAVLGASFVACYGLVFLLLLLSMFFDNQPGRYQSWVDKMFNLQAVSTKG